MSLKKLDLLIKDHQEGKAFTAEGITLLETDLKFWVRFKVEPQRFLPKIFEGDWAFTQKNPEIGPIRIVRIITGTDGISRVIARQGKYIYAYPWIA